VTDWTAADGKTDELTGKQTGQQLKKDKIFIN
jgi:hypothetical protein